MTAPIILNDGNFHFVFKHAQPGSLFRLPMIPKAESFRQSFPAIAQSAGFVYEEEPTLSSESVPVYRVVTAAVAEVQIVKPARKPSSSTPSSEARLSKRAHSISLGSFSQLINALNKKGVDPVHVRCPEDWKFSTFRGHLNWIHKSHVVIDNQDERLVHINECLIRSINEAISEYLKMEESHA